MVTDSLCLPAHELDVISAMRLGAEQDAELVAAFLQAIEVRACSRQPLALPESFLLELGAALRLLEWESHGFEFQSKGGLPPGRASDPRGARKRRIPEGWHPVPPPDYPAFVPSAPRLEQSR